MLTLMPVQRQSSDGRNAARRTILHQLLSLTQKDMQINFLHYFLLLFSLEFISI